jgi:CheY-like chemotaxis protein
VLLDIHLGDALSGEDIMRHLRAQPGNEGLPIVALTAFALPGDRARFLAAGFDAYLTKPYTRDALLETVDAIRTARAPEAPAQETPAMIVRNPEAGHPAPARRRDGASAEPHTPR